MPVRRLERLGLALLMVLAVTGAGSAERVRPGLDLGELLGGAQRSGFERATEPGRIRFPRDHGAHPDFRSGWWYLTANLTSADGRRFGLQLTFFRQALAPPRREPLRRASDWRTRQVWMAHLALTDAANGHVACERFARGALRLAGAQAVPFQVWLDGWRLEHLADAGNRRPFPAQLQASATCESVEIAVDLELRARKPPVLQGERGLSRKSDTPGNASYYYSYTRLEAVGRLRRGERRYRVHGQAWLDREWSTSVLEPEHSGWDWLALQLEDGREVMVYRLRRRNDAVAAAREAVIIDTEGNKRRLSPSAWTLTPREWWRGPEGARWPVAWRLAIPSAGVAGKVEPLVEDQLMRTAVRYWEGAVVLKGASSGRGYLELTGYGEVEGPP